MYHVYMTNFDYLLEQVFKTEREAIEFGKSKGFECQIYANWPTQPTLVASWSPIGGRRFHR